MGQRSADSEVPNGHGLLAARDSSLMPPLCHAVLSLAVLLINMVGAAATSTVEEDVGRLEITMQNLTERWRSDQVTH